MATSDPSIRLATVRDVRSIRALVEPYVESRAIVPKPVVAYYESVQEFRVVELDGRIVGCGAVHAMWDNVAEIRTVAVDPAVKGRGVGSLLLRTLIQEARDLGVSRLFCLTFETDFFAHHGFREIEGQVVAPAVYAELLQSYDEGVAEFLDLERIKPNTLGNTRMLLDL
ncbi:amino-acid N-acetyltransferase [Demetria terragena]|uniref:amino-acid N-acetyltransferase n=1 Tax=Demetria terragena TaxID=63959 RepID=UPI00036B0D63|nr:amino-acid N-acetyltransferase [Demetria terragena]